MTRDTVATETPSFSETVLMETLCRSFIAISSIKNGEPQRMRLPSLHSEYRMNLFLSTRSYSMEAAFSAVTRMAATGVFSGSALAG